MPTYAEDSCMSSSPNGRNLTIDPVDKFCDVSPRVDSMSEKTEENPYQKPERMTDDLVESSRTFDDDKTLASSSGRSFFSNENPTPVAEAREKQSENYFNFPLSTKSEGCFTPTPPSMEDHSQPMRAPPNGKLQSLTPTNLPFSRSSSLSSPLPSPSLKCVAVLSTKTAKRNSTPKKTRKSMPSPRRSPFIALPGVEGYRTPKAASNFAKMISGSFKKSNAICQ